MILETSRFGRVEVAEKDILFFAEGLLGFADLKKFILIDDPGDDIFAWLQSCESAAIAFPVLEPELFSEKYKIQLSKSDLEALKTQNVADLRSFSIITIPEDPTLMTANLKAPIILNLGARIARQCVLQDNSLAIREPIFQKLQQRVISHPQISIKYQSNALDGAVKVRGAAETEISS